MPLPRGFTLFSLSFTLVFGVLNVQPCARGAVFMIRYAALYAVVQLAPATGSAAFRCNALRLAIRWCWTNVTRSFKMNANRAHGLNVGAYKLFSLP